MFTEDGFAMCNNHIYQIESSCQFFDVNKNYLVVDDDGGYSMNNIDGFQGFNPVLDNILIEY